MAGNQQIIYISGKLASAATTGDLLNSFAVDNGYIVVDSIETLNNLLNIYVDRNLTATVYVIDEQTTYLYENGVATLHPELNRIFQAIADINSKIPEDADSSNQLVDRESMEEYALPITTKYGASLYANIDSSTYILTLQLKDQYGNNLGQSQTVDLPLESVVVSGEYDDTTKSLILTLQNGNTIVIPVGDLVDGLVPDSRKIADIPLENDISASDLKEALDLENVVNTGDSPTPVLGGTQKFTTGGAYTELNKKMERAQTITVDDSQVIGYGNDVYTTAPYIRFVPTQEQAAILANEDVQVIKLDLTALGNTAPAPYVWVKRNTKVTVNNFIAHQFTCGGEQFWYDNYATDIAIKNIGNAAMVFVPDFGIADITLLNISVPDLYDKLGKIPTNIENGIGSYSLQQKYTNSLDEHANGGTALGGGSIALGIGDIYESAVVLDVVGNSLYFFGNEVNPNWQNMVCSYLGEYRRITSVITGPDIVNTITLSSAFTDNPLGSKVKIITQVAAGKASSVKGEYCQAFGEASSAEGIACKSVGDASHTEGYYCLSNQAYAHTEGQYNIGSGIASHVEGSHNTVFGNHSHAEGEYNTVLHTGAHVSGSHNQSTRNNQTVIGEYANLTRSDTLLNVGVGNSDNDRRSALQVLKDGRVKILTGPISADDAVTKGYADGHYGPLHEDRKILYATSSTETSEGSGKYTQTVVAYSAGLNRGCIVQRDGRQILVPDAPTQNNHATSKKYVDDKIDSAIVAVYKPKGKSSVSILNGLTKTASMNGYVYDMTDSGTLTNYDGTTETVRAKDNVCFFWNDGDWYWDNFGEVVDLSNYVQKTTEIAGLQINNGISASSLLNELFTVSTVTVDEE